jgi:hypothetical protein
MGIMLDVLSFGQQRAAGDIARGESKVAAQQEELGAVQRESDRKGRLAEAMASQNAAAGASGVAAFEGSPLTVLQEDIKTEERATQRDKFQTKLGAATTRARGKIAQTQAKTGASIGLLRSVEKRASKAATDGAS